MSENEATCVSDYIDGMSLASFSKWVQDSLPKGVNVEETRVLDFKYMKL